jgi:2-keto-4-pentenoate hydratase/2-oxohepta-3-ene-1,7-dioic acid hydratase in catechol pathway
MFGLGMFSDDGGRTFAGLVVERERVVDLSPEGWASTREILDDWDASLERLKRIADEDDGGGEPLKSLVTLPPICPVQILQSGANYRQHVIDLIVVEERQRGELSEDEALAMGGRIMDERAAHGEPYMFFGSVTAMCGAFDDVILPRDGDQHDWELELAAVVGRTGRDIPVESALDHVAGYTIVNDLTTRDLVYRPDIAAIGTDWLRSKNSPTFLPTGPYIVPAEFVPDPMSLELKLRLNGQLMQDGSTSDMIYDVAQLVSYASRRVALKPGDLVLTGSPEGNGAHHGRFLTDGDVMEGEITFLGLQRNRCVRDGQAA